MALINYGIVNVDTYLYVLFTLMHDRIVQTSPLTIPIMFHVRPIESWQCDAKQVRTFKQTSATVFVDDRPVAYPVGDRSGSGKTRRSTLLTGHV